MADTIKRNRSVSRRGIGHSGRMNDSEAEQTPVSGISLMPTRLRSWTAAELRGKNEAISGDAEHRPINLTFFE